MKSQINFAAITFRVWIVALFILFTLIGAVRDFYKYICAN